MATRTMHATSAAHFFFSAGALLAACGGATAPRPANGAAPNRYEFPVDTRDSIAEMQSFVGADGRLNPAVIRGYVRAHLGTVFGCYDSARLKEPELKGRITVKYVIGEDGMPRDVVAENPTVPNSDVVECTLRLFRRLRYDPNRSGNLTIVYPIELTPAPPGRRTDPFFDTHDGSYGFAFDPVNVARVRTQPPPVDIVPPVGPQGRLLSDAIQVVVIRNLGAIARCSTGGGRGAPKSTEIVTVKYIIGEDGKVKAIADEIAAETDKELANCVFDVFRELKYPASRGGNVSVMFPVQFGP